MNLETRQPGSPPSSLPGSPPASLADVLEARRDDIIHHWVERLREGLIPEPRTRSVLENHVGEYLQELATVLHRTGQGGAAALPEESNVAREHGRQRLSIGFNLAALVREYGVLHECILDSLEQTEALVTLAELRALTTFIIHGIAPRSGALHHPGDRPRSS